MQKWEYMYVPNVGIEVGFENRINQLGSEGWELAVQYGTGLIFKRPIS